MEKNLKDLVKKFPLKPGIYLMKDAQGAVLYVGKASSLRKRVLSYFSKTVAAKTQALMEHVCDIEYILCDSEEQALILEAALIKEKQPRYNISLRDDKSYPYIEISQGPYPRVFVSRPRNKQGKRLFGPYTNVRLIRSALKLIRRIFPFCTCRKLPNRPCLYAHLGLCPAPCAGKISVEEYQETIESISKILQGDRKALQKQLQDKMQQLAQQKEFEKAAKVRDTITAVNNLYSGTRSVPQLVALKDVLGLAELPLVMEAIDISNISGTLATGSVVVFRDGSPDKNSYRRYRIKTVQGIDDYAMIAEVVRRRYSRLQREGTGLPDLVIIDGGRGHVQTAQKVFDELNIKIPVIGIAKRNEEIWFPGQPQPLLIPKDHSALHLIQSIRDEAHRFARKYHLWRRSKGMRE